MKTALRFISLHFLFISIAFAQTPKQTIITTDIDNFWTAFDQLKTTTDSLKQLDILQQLYVDKGTHTHTHTHTQYRSASTILSSA